MGKIDLSHFPIIGPWVSRIGRVEQLWATQCSPSPQIWALAAWHAFPKAIASVAKPFPLAETWHAITNDRHHRRQGRPRKSFPTGRPSLGFRAVEVIDGAPKPGIPGWAAFEGFGDAVFKAQWYLLLADVTADGLINWVSTAYTMQGCLDEDPPWFQGTPLIGELGLPGPGPGYVDAWRFTKHGNVFCAGPTVNWGQGVYGTIGATISCGKNPEIPSIPAAEYEARLVDFSEGTPTPYTPATKGPDGLWHWSGAINNRIKHHGGGGAVFEYNKGPGAMWMYDGKYSGQGYTGDENTGILPDP